MGLYLGGGGGGGGAYKRNKTGFEMSRRSVDGNTFFFL